MSRTSKSDDQMINQLNKGCILGFYAEEKYQQRHTNPNGSILLASEKYLLPFMFWQDGAPLAINKFRLISTKTGEQIALSASYINRKKKADNSRTWYYFNGDEITEDVPCGDYYFWVDLGGPQFFSDVIRVQKLDYGNHFFPLFETLTPAPIVKVLHTGGTGSGPQFAEAWYQIGGAGPQIPTSVSLFSNYTTFELPNGPLTPPFLKVRYWFQNQNGIAREVFLSVVYQTVSPFKPTDIQVMSYSFTESINYFQIRIGSSKDLDQVIYSTGWKQWIYLEGGNDFPQNQVQIETSINGSGESLLLSQTSRTKLQIGLIEIPDQALETLLKMPILDACDILDLKTSQQYNSLKEVEFEPKDQQRYTSSGTLRFQSSYQQTGACLENIGVVNV